MKTDKESIEVVNKLLKLTGTEELKWEPYTYSIMSISGQEYKVGGAYKTEYKDILFRIYRYTAPAQINEYEYANKIFHRLEIIDDSDNQIYEFPKWLLISTLYEAVRYQVEGISEIFKRIITEEPQNNKQIT